MRRRAEAGVVAVLRAPVERVVVLVDQLGFMRRCGFDAFEPDQPFDDGEVRAALSRFPHAYQPAAAGAQPIWALRHPPANG